MSPPTGKFWARFETRNFMLAAIYEYVCKMHTRPAYQNINWITIGCEGHNQAPRRPQFCKIMERKDFAPLISWRAMWHGKSSQSERVPLAHAFQLIAAARALYPLIELIRCFLSELHTKLRRREKTRSRTKISLKKHTQWGARKDIIHQARIIKVSTHNYYDNVGLL